MQLKDKLPTMSEDEQFELLASDGMLVKRPILIGDGFVLVGFKEADWACLFYIHGGGFVLKAAGYHYMNCLH